MNHFPLPPTSKEQPPAFVSPSACRLWLDELPLANIVQSQSLILRQLTLLNRYPLLAAERLQILEYMRVPLSVIQEGSVPRYASKAMPLAPAEQASFEATMALWNALALGYLHCLDAVLEAGGSAPGQIAILAQRALATMCEAQADSYPGARLPTVAFWKLFNQIYAVAEAHAAAEVEVEDLLRNGRRRTTPVATYVEALLLNCAGPSEFPNRQYGWLVRWSRRWAARVVVRKDVPEDPRATPLCVDVESDRPLITSPSGQGSGGLRWLDITELRSSIRKRLQKLAEGVAPADLGLGSDCVMPGCSEVLEHVYQRWCRGVPPRRVERRTAAGRCFLIGGVDNIHGQFSGRVFQQPGAGLTTQQHDEIALFGQRAAHQGPSTATKQGVIEEWASADESALGLHITRPLHQLGGRFGIGQLVAARPDNAKQFLLGWLRWIHVDEQDLLHGGVQVFPGVPEPIAARNRSSALVAEKFRPAFLLPEIAAVKIPARIVIPAGMFRQDLVIEIFRTELARIRLTRLLERGGDFEYVAFQGAP
jgi:hypothetical protein